MKEKATELTQEQAVVNIAYTAWITEDPLETIHLAYQFLEFFMTRESSRKRAVPTKKKAEPTKKPVTAVAPKKKRPGRPSRSNEPWTDEEKQKILWMREKGLTVSKIAKEIGRSYAATNVALNKLQREIKRQSA